MSGPSFSGVTMDRIGAFTWHPGTDRWTWNDTAFHLLGYEPGEVRPSRALVVSHKHPADRTRVEDVLADAVAHRLAYTLRHRIVSITGEVHEVTVIGYPADGGPDRSGGLLFQGFLVHLATHAASRPAAAPSVVGSAPPTVPFAAPRTVAPLWALDPTREHDRYVARAVSVLAEAAELPDDAAGHLLAHLANSAAVPLVVIADRVLAVSLDPDVHGLGDLLAGIQADVPEPD